MPTAEPAVDTEFHFLIQCPLFNSQRNRLFDKLSEVNLSFANLSLAEKFKVMLCPTTAFTNIKDMFVTREKYAEENLN